MEKNLAKTQQGTLVNTIAISTPTDLLKAKPIVLRLQEEPYELLVTEVVKWVSKCADALDLGMTKSQIRTLTIDIIETYKTESLEDIREVLMKGRRGYYTKNFGKLNMIVLAEWFGQHLEDKARAREQQHTKEQRDDRAVSLIDRIDEKRKLLNEKWNRNEDITEDLKEFNDMKEELKDKTDKYRKRVDKKPNNHNPVKAERQRNKRSIELQQWRIVVTDYTLKQLNALITTTKDVDVRQIAKEELKSREDGNNKHQEQSTEVA